MTLLDRIIHTSSTRSVILIRLMVGAVFVSEGIQKFLFPESVGAGRFAKIEFAVPVFTAYWVACFEVVCGSLILVGLLTRLAVIPTTTIMLVAIWTTKIPILQESGFWKMAHDARTDYAMLLGSVYLLIVGGGVWSIDHLLSAKRSGLTNGANASQISTDRAG